METRSFAKSWHSASLLVSYKDDVVLCTVSIQTQEKKKQLFFTFLVSAEIQAQHKDTSGDLFHIERLFHWWKSAGHVTLTCNHSKYHLQKHD